MRTLFKFLGSLVLSAAVFTVGATQDAAAAVSLTNGASASAQINCSQSLDWMRTTLDIRPRAGLSRQTVAFREYVSFFNGTGGWTNWTTLTAPVRTTFVKHLDNMNFKVYVQYAWLQNGNWTYAGEWIKSYGQVQGAGTSYIGYCAV